MLRTGRFGRLWAANAVSNLGDGLRVTALPLLAASLTRDPAAIAAVSAVVWLPWLVFGLVGGTIVDRLPRVRLLVGVQLGRLVVIGALAVAVWTGNASMAWIYLVAFGIGLGEVLADTTLQTLIPAVVPESELERANGQIYAAQSVANDFAGPPVGSVLFSTLAAAPFVANAAAWGISAALLAGMRVEAPARVATTAPTSFVQDVVSGARWLWAHPVLRPLLIWGAVVNASLTAFSSIYVLFALEILGIGEAAFGFLAAAIGLGGIGGTLAAGWLVSHIGRSRIIAAGGIVGGGAAMLAGLTSEAIGFAGLMIVLMGVAAAVSIVVAALRQAIVPNEMLGRVHATFRVFSYGSIPLGALVGGWLAGALGLRAPYLIGGGVMLVAGLLVGRWVTGTAIDEARRAARPGAVG